MFIRCKLCKRVSSLKFYRLDLSQGLNDYVLCLSSQRKPSTQSPLLAGYWSAYERTVFLSYRAPPEAHNLTGLHEARRGGIIAMRLSVS